jgi:hypothetical protein
MCLCFTENATTFQLVRQVPVEDGGAPIDIIVDFLMPRDAEIVNPEGPKRLPTASGTSERCRRLRLHCRQVRHR